MFANLIESFLLGFAISAVPGAVFFETLRRSLLDYSSIFRFLMGNFSGMICIVAASFYGLTRLLSGELFSVIFYFVSGSLLVYIGVTAITVNAHTLERLSNATSSKTSAYLVGFTLAVANPISIIFWASLLGKLIKENGEGPDAVVYSIFVLAGAAVFFILLVAIVKYARKQLTTNRLVFLSRTFGVLITIYGLNTFIAAAKQFWS